MLRTRYAAAWHIFSLRRTPNVFFANASTWTQPGPHAPNAALELDPSLQALLKDADMALLEYKIPRQHVIHEGCDSEHLRELEVLPFEHSGEHFTLADAQDNEVDSLVSSGWRKSFSAAFGSQGIGSVYIPVELRSTIERLVAESDKSTLRSDAKRLFQDSSVADDDNSWNSSSSVKYKSRKQAARRAETDGTAFATIALPAHYSVIVSVLDHVKHRLGESWKIERVLDWGSGTGSALWATMHSFQRRPAGDEEAESDEPQISQSSVLMYLGIEKRGGLTAMAKRLLNGVNTGNASLSWQKGYTDTFRARRSEGADMLALSAFTLSSLPTPLARKELVKEMWESGAEVIILIDHDSPAGFESIADSREYLLRMGRRELDDPDTSKTHHTGCHVVAPCPHDKPCPLHVPGSSRLICSFSQRMQRPEFLRKTKHVKAGHEDNGYTYVVIRRGRRPSTSTSGETADDHPSTSAQVIGEEDTAQLAGGRGDALDKQSRSSDGPPTPVIRDYPAPARRQIEDTSSPAELSPTQRPDTSNNLASDAAPSAAVISEMGNAEVDQVTEREKAMEDLRAQAYAWPRLVVPPMKKSGHVILDSCTVEGKIMRLTIPRSQGKQEYYDARKSSWGDIFPHPPKNAPQVRSQTTHLNPHSNNPAAGSDIGKRKSTKHARNKPGSSYSFLAAEMKASKKQKKRERAQVKRGENTTDSSY